LIHAISSYLGNRPTNKQTHRQDRLQCTVPQLASALCNQCSTAINFRPGLHKLQPTDCVRPTASRTLVTRHPSLSIRCPTINTDHNNQDKIAVKTALHTAETVRLLGLYPGSLGFSVPNSRPPSMPAWTSPWFSIPPTCLQPLKILNVALRNLQDLHFYFKPYQMSKKALNTRNTS